MLDSFSYQLNSTGQRTGITDADGTISSYDYDAIHRLESETVTDNTNTVIHAASYQYDNTANRIQGVVNGITTAYSYDDNDRLTQQGGEQYTYDANGNTLKLTIDNKVTDYQYNALDQLVQVQKSDAGAITDTLIYAYDIDGNRVNLQENGSETRFIVDNNQAYAQVVQEQDASGQTQVSYLYGDDLLQQQRGTEVSHYHYDGLGSTRLLTDATGALTDRYRYEAFGDAIEELGNTPNRYRFTGEQHDSNLGFYYLRARYYNPHQGRFTQQDSWMGNNAGPITLHKYLYANANPVSYTDPSGYMSIGSLGTSISIVGALTTMANVGITGLGVANASLDSDQIPDAAIITLGGSIGSGGGMAEASGDFIIDLKSGRAWFYGSFGVGLSPASLFKGFKGAGATKAVGLIWNFNNPNEWSGFSVGANWPVSILRLLPAANLSDNKMWGAMTQLAKRERNVRTNDLTFQIGVSTGGPAALRVSQRSNSFSSSVNFGSSPIEVPVGSLGGLAHSLANDFGNALDEF